MSHIETIAADLEFAQSTGEFENQSQVLRFVIGCHIGQLSRQEIIGGLVAAGYRANSVGNRYNEVRQCFDELDAN